MEKGISAYCDMIRLGEKIMTSSGIEEKVLDLIDQSKDDNVALMQRLVQIPSYTGQEAELGDFLVKEVEKFGLDDARIVQQMLGRPNIMADYHGKTGKPSLTVYAHFDTVPIGDIMRWDYGPFSGAIVDNRIYGRGATDHKFPIPPLLFAIRAIKDAGVTLNGDIIFAFVCDEEFGGHRGMKYLVDQGLCDTDYLLYASTGGSQGESIGLAANGRGFYRIIVKGDTRHTGRNDLGVNAAVKAAKLISRLEELRQEVNNRLLKFKAGDVEIEGKARFSINLVDAYLTGNNVPDRCTIQIDRRLVPQHETYESGQAEIQAVIDKLAEEDPELDAVIEWNPEGWMNFSVSVPDSPIVKSLQRSVKKVLGVEAGIGKGPIGHSSDHGWFQLKYPDRPFASYAVGRGGDSHTYNEYVTIDGLIDTTKIYALTMMDLLGVA